MIQQQCLNIFNENLDYFKSTNLEVYNKIIEFKNIIEAGKIKHRYSLEYIDEKFNLLHILSNTLFYKSTDDFDKIATEAIDYSNRKNTITPISVEALNSKYIEKLKNERDNRDSIKTIKKLKVLLKNIDSNYKKKKEFKSVGKFIFMGVILGTHLDSIHKKISSKNYLIIEPDIEIFYLSMFVSKYYDFAPNAKKVYSIMDDENELLNKLNTFQTIDFDKNYCIKYYLASNSYSNIFETLSVSLISQNPLSYTYNSYLKNVKRTVAHIKHNANILDLSKETRIFDDKPILVVSPGPSVEQHLKWLKKYQDRFIIVSFSQMAKKLVNASIIPDIITIIDAEKVIEEHFRFKEVEKIRNTLLLTTTNVYPSIFENFKKENIFLFEKNSTLKRSSIPMLGNTVGEVTYFLLLKFKAEQIYLLGVDLAVTKDGKTHEKGHTSNILKKSLTVRKIKEINYEEETKVDQEQALIKVEGNFSEYVFTTFFFKNIIQNYKSITQQYKLKNQKVYNLSDGAKLFDISAFSNIRKFKDYPVIKKLKLHKTLKENFTNISEQSIDNEEQSFIKLEIQRIDNILSDELFVNGGIINDYKEFDLKIKKLINKVLIHEKNNYSIMCFNICYNYLNINCNFIDYILNDKYKTFNYSKIYTVLIQQIKAILNKYKKSCKKLL